MVRRCAAQARHGPLPFVVTYDDRLVGQVTVGGITWGSLCSAHVGYWVDQRVAGRGVMPTAVALVTDHCFGTVGLHRMEVNIRPENGPSRRVVEKLGFREEGLRGATCTSTATGATPAASRSPPRRSPTACSPAGVRPSSRTPLPRALPS